jgi:hypothetical protein
MEAMNELQGYLTQTSDTEVTTSSTKNRKKEPMSMDTDSEDDDISSKFVTNQRNQSQVKSAKKPLTSASTTATRPPQQKPISMERYKYIPMRLSEAERKLLDVLNSALEVCEYTDVVDVTFSHTRKNKLSRIMESLVDILSIVSGLMLAGDLVKGEALVAGKTLNDNVPFFSTLFEVIF